MTRRLGDGLRTSEYQNVVGGVAGRAEVGGSGGRRRGSGARPRGVRRLTDVSGERALRRDTRDARALHGDAGHYVSCGRSHSDCS